MEIESAYIIRIKDHKVSEQLSNRCYDSCVSVNMPVKYWDAIDGTDGKTIKNPHKKEYMFWPKVYNRLLSFSAISAFFSHYSLWCHCISIDRPIVIFEDDAIVIKNFTHHKYNKAIVYLGNSEQYFNVEEKEKHSIFYEGIGEKSERFIKRCHAYSIDPLVSRQLVCQTITQGITCPVDQFIRSDYYAIVQDDIYAYDKETEKKHRRISYEDIDYISRGIIPAYYG